MTSQLRVPAAKSRPLCNTTKTLTAQVYLLSQSHVGAMNSTARLPITTYYADRASEAAAEGYLPETSKLRQNIGFI